MKTVSDLTATEVEQMANDLHALMWCSGDGCEICAYKIVEQREPYTRYGCSIGGAGKCKPLWRGFSGDPHCNPGEIPF